MVDRPKMAWIRRENIQSKKHTKDTVAGARTSSSVRLASSDTHYQSSTVFVSSGFAGPSMLSAWVFAHKYR